jgi:hypothetical protein
MSNPTTPFSWQMPTATDLVTDLPADFAVFGQAVATSMADLLGGTTGQVLSKTTNADMDFTWVSANPGDITGVTAGTGISGGGTSGTVTVTNDMATTITTNGDLIYGTGSGTYTRRGIGSTGNVLTVSGGVPVWAAPAGGGKVLQVVQAEYSTGTTIASTTFTDTGLTASITPSASNSKVLVLVSQPAYIGYSTGSSVGASAQIVRGATAVFVQGAGKDSLYFTIQVSGQSDLQLGQNISMIYLDSPATTSATTYKTQAAVSSTASGRNITAQYNSSKSTITLIEIGA